MPEGPKAEDVKWGGGAETGRVGLPVALGSERSTLNGCLGGQAPWPGQRDAVMLGGRLHPHGDTLPDLYPLPECRTPLGTSRQDRFPEPPAQQRCQMGTPTPQPVTPRSFPRGAAPALPSLGDPGGVPRVRGQAMPARVHHPSAQPSQACTGRAQGVRVHVCACALRAPVPTAAVSAAQPQCNTRSNHSFRWLVLLGLGFFIYLFFFFSPPLFFCISIIFVQKNEPFFE